jgi:competence protein ComEC
MRGVGSPSFWQAPLAPAALAATAGVVADRYLDVPLPLSLAAVAAGLAAWALALSGRQAGLPLLYLLGSVAALGAAYHHAYREVFAQDDVSRFASAEPRPAVLRGALEEEPAASPALPHDPLRSLDPRATTRTVLRVTSVRQRSGWARASGLARLTVVGRLTHFHVGDEVEVVGRLLAPQGPSNPGEMDYACFLRDQRICAVVQVREAPDGVRLLAERSPLSPAGWLALVRGRAHRTLEELLPEEQQGLAMALLLGEDYMLGQREWDKYQRTGVIHVLAISGQHLSVLAGFLWVILRFLGLRRRQNACVIAAFLLGYALMSGGRPPVMRAAVMVCAVCGGELLGRQVWHSNLFALAWLVVMLLNPTDIFNAGCQLSFLSVAILAFALTRSSRGEPHPLLAWGLPRHPDATQDPLKLLIARSRPPWQKRLLRLRDTVWFAYVGNVGIWLAVAPLIAARFNAIPLIGIVIGPPVVLVTAVALLAGFLALLLAPFCWPLAHLAAWVVRLGLAACDWLVSWAENKPCAYCYVSEPSAWWLWVFYVTLFAGLTIPALRPRWKQLGLVLLAWLCVGLVAAVRPRGAGELRCTFLAVGHGGCTVLETPDGRVLLYDAGAMSGPDMTRRVLAPFLWNRRIRRVDEVFLSHADLDHFNGLSDLLSRFAVGHVSCTPTFAGHTKPAVRLTVAALERHGVPLRVLHAGDRLTAGDVTLDVLHPPPDGPEGNENARSMVLLVRHEGHAILLTGDLEGPGQERVLAMPRLALDVLQAPHHGSRLANTPALARWARPRLAISCQGPPRWPPRGPDPYQAVGARLLTTWEHGAVTLRSTAGRLSVETFRTGECWTVAAGARDGP